MAEGPKGGAAGRATTPTSTAAVPAHLVYLDVDDEITSAAARIRATDAEQITLVLPYGSRLATSRINFRLLAREATERGKRLDIVCADASARALAAAAGLPAHASVAAFEAARGAAAEAPSSNGHDDAGGAGTATIAAVQRQLPLPELADMVDAPTRVVTKPRRAAPRVPLVGPARAPIPPRVAIAAGAGIVVALVALGVLALQLLPAATIVLHPRSQPVGPLALTVQARPDVTTVDAANLVMPAQRLTFDLSASKTVTATGTKVVDSKATGSVTFSNFDNGRGVVIPAGTTVRTQKKVEFVTLTELTLPRAQQDFFPPFATHPSSGSVGIEAVVPGEGGNVGNNTITEVPGAGKLLKVNNPDPTTGGAHAESPQIVQSDVDAAIAAIAQDLAADLAAQVAGGTAIPSAFTVFTKTQAVGTPQYATDPQSIVGTEGPTAEVQATAEGSVLAVDASPIQGLAESRLAGEVETGWTLVEGSSTFKMDAPTIFGGVITFPVTVSATEVRVVDEDALGAQIRGLLASQARSRLEAYGDVSISLWPDWVTTIPTNADRIDLSIEAPQPAPSPSP